MHYGSRHGHTEDFFMLETGVKIKCNKLLKIWVKQKYSNYMSDSVHISLWIEWEKCDVPFAEERK